MTILSIQPPPLPTTRWMDIHRQLELVIRQPPSLILLLIGIAGLCWLGGVSILLAPIHLGGLIMLWGGAGLVVRRDWHEHAIASLLEPDGMRFRDAVSRLLGIIVCAGMLPCIGYGILTGDGRWIGMVLLGALASLPVVFILRLIPGVMPSIAWVALRSRTSAWTMDHALAALQHPQPMIRRLGEHWLVQAARAASLDDLVLWLSCPPPIRADIAAAELARRAPDSPHRS